MPTRDDALDAVARSMPNTARPRLSTALEERLEPLERASALTYADGELACERLNRLAAALLQTSDGVPDADMFGDTSTVNHLEELRELTREETLP
jgi:hypothetical protein